MAPGTTRAPRLDLGDPRGASVEGTGRSDPFPREEVVDVLRRLPSYARLAYGLSLEPELPRIRRIALLGAFAYLVSPIDAIPGLIPVIGQLDDVLVVLLTLRFALGGLTPEQRHRHLGAAGLTEADTAADLEAIADVGAWLLRAGGRVGMRASAVALDVGGHWGARAARRTGAVAARVGGAGSRRLGTLVTTRVPRPALRRRRGTPPS
jgi:uncharacterized membrane protein YkvA (DUF1232 family)